MRARWAPRQKWIPCPKDRCAFGDRVMSKCSGSENFSGSRLAAELNHRTRSDVRMVLPLSSMSCKAILSRLGAGGS